MKSIINADSRNAVSRIEAARLSFEILSDSLNELKQSLRSLEGNREKFEIGKLTMRRVWEYIDWSFRFASVMSQIRGLKHKDPRFKALESDLLNIEFARNFIQHLNSEIPKTADVSYPVSGCILWSSADRKIAFASCMGTISKGMHMNTLTYDKVEGKYVDGFFFASRIDKSMWQKTLMCLRRHLLTSMNG